MTDPADAVLHLAPSPGSSMHVVCIGSAALDVLMEIDTMPPEDGRIAALDGMLAGGGPAATAAVALARLGISVDLISVTGDDVAGDLIVGGLAREGVGTRFVRRAPGARSALSMGLIRPTPANTRSLIALAAMGTAIAIDDAALEACRTASWIHVDHAGWPLVGWLRQRGVTTPVSVDGGNPLTPTALTDADLYVPGATELVRSTGRPDIASALESVATPVGPLTIVTQGAEGSTYRGVIGPTGAGADAQIRTLSRDPSRRIHAAHVNSPTVSVRSTLGAGDVYHGALLAGLLRGHSVLGAMTYASTAAAMSCRALDGRSAIPTHDEVATAMHLPHATP
ncbi:MAG: PfkB family carbohydrate kinase [Chloroflexi bacterium]|nr:PfkB family carbohydrate kinase [Chloroflexota bacterium]